MHFPESATCVDALAAIKVRVWFILYKCSCCACFADLSPLRLWCGQVVCRKNAYSNANLLCTHPPPPPHPHFHLYAMKTTTHPLIFFPPIVKGCWPKCKSECHSRANSFVTWGLHRLWYMSTGSETAMPLNLAPESEGTPPHSPLPTFPT